MDNPEDFNVKEIKGQESAGFSLKKPEEKPKPRKKYIYIGVGLAIVVVLVVFILAFFRGWFSFSKEKVDVRIVAPAEVSSGEEVEIAVYYQNNNRVALKDAKIIIDYPRGTYSVDGNELTQETVELGKIPPKMKGIKDFKIRLVGEKGGIRSLAVKFNYQPANINSRFENLASFKINISSVLVGLYLTVPQKAINGEEVFYTLDYLNNSDKDFSDFKIELDYPLGFSFKAAEPLPTEDNNIWQLKELKKGERGTISIVGILEGIEAENKTLLASIGGIKNGKFLKYSQTSAVTQISSSPLLVIVSLNKEEEEINVSSGEELNYKIDFKNNTDIALSQLILKAYLQGEMFDFKTLKLSERGFFDSLNNVITWSAAGVPSLALLSPGESGEVSFSLSTRKDFPIDDFNDKNFQLYLRAELETLNVPLQFNLERLKVEKILSSNINSKVVLQAKGYYKETTTNIENFGPIPPKVHQITTYTIHWQVTNTSNDLENVRVTAVLPQGIEWQDVYTALNKDTQLEYNERTKQIVWEVGKVPAATGFLIPAHELIFQIALRPSITQIGTMPVLIDESSLEGKDTFTGEILESFSPAIATNLPDDLSISKKEGWVVE